jgi:hypothetical protein
MRNAGQFVTAVHRRLIVLRIVEQLGLGFFFASLAAAALVGIAIWQSMPTMPILIFCGALGLLIGSILAIFRWPTRIAAAAEADRQLRLEDLLSTVLFSTRSSDDDFNRAVIAMADARCRSHSPSEIVLRQFGIRRWSGIALAMAFAATLAVIPLAPARSQPNDANVAVLSANTLAENDNQSLQRQQGEALPTNNPMSDTAAGNSQTDEKTNDPSASTALPSSGSERGNTAGVGGGSSTTHANTGQKLQTASAWSNPDRDQGAVAGGGNTAGNNGSPADAHSGLRNAAQSSLNTAPISAGNSQSDMQKSSPVQDDQIPANDRNLVRDFFNQK